MCHQHGINRQHLQLQQYYKFVQIASSELKATGGMPTSEPFNSSTLSDCSMAVHGAGRSDGVAAVEHKKSQNVIKGGKFPNLPMLASNALADTHENDKFESPKGAPPTFQPGLGLKAAAFLNQGDSEDSDAEVSIGILA